MKDFIKEQLEKAPNIDQKDIIFGGCIKGTGFNTYFIMTNNDVINNDTNLIELVDIWAKTV